MGGGWHLRSRVALAAHERSVGEMLRRWSEAAPDRVLVAERFGRGEWRSITYAKARRAAHAIGQALLDRGLGPHRPVMVLSANSVNHALLMLGCYSAGVPIVPVSTAYSLQSRDFIKLRRVASLVSPGLVYVEDETHFHDAVGTLSAGFELFAGKQAPKTAATSFMKLLDTEPGESLERAYESVSPDTVAKILFTSGSTGSPKGVPTTHRMMCVNQAAMAQVWPFLAHKPPVLVDWLPWSHTFGGSHNLNMVLKNGGSLYIDGGRPLPGLMNETLDNLREIAPTIYFNVPAGFATLVPALEADAALAARFFERLRLIFWAGAALSPDLWERLRVLALKVTGREVAMTTSWGATETAPAATSAHFALDGPGNIGVPLPGVEIALAPVGAKFELRVRGPNVMPGYVGSPELAATGLDQEGYYRTGDAGTLIDSEHPEAGIRFDGRLAEDFKLATGTWVSAGNVRTAVLAAADGLLQDVVVTGHDQPFIGLLGWVNRTAARRVVGRGVDASDPAALVESAELREALRHRLSDYARSSLESSRCVRRLTLLVDPPSLDRGEITDKGYLNQRAVLDTRAAEVAAMHSPDPGPGVIVLDVPERS